MDKLRIILLIIVILSFSNCLAKTQKEEYKNDILYSQAYFDYLIEQASIEANKKKDMQQKEQEELEVTLDETVNEDIIEERLEPFKLKITENSKISPYGESYKVVDTKTIISVGDNLNFFQNTTKSRNKYNSNDYKILAGAEIGEGRIVSIASGIEANYRNYDQLPVSRKIYLTPTLNIGNRVYFKLHNKLNLISNIQDHDIELSISPFKSKVLDFGVYAGTSYAPSGAHSESINFSTTFYFF